MNNEWDWTQASTAHWQAFRNTPSPFKFDKILDRNQLPLPDWYVPPAQGVVVPSQYYLSARAGFEPKTHRAGGWRHLKRVDGYHNFLRYHRHLSRRCGNLFSVERSWDRNCAFGAVLAHRFASTPVFTRTLEEAQYLSQLKQPPSELRWVTLVDPNKNTSDESYRLVHFEKLTR